jgi:glycosyltransferase involved in cell wall biosynthesis
MPKLRILLTIDDASLGGGQMHVLLLAKYLRGDKFDVEIATEATGWLVDEARKLNLVVHQIKISNQLTWQSFDRVRQLLESQKFDVIHTHGGTAGFWVRVAVLALKRRPQLVHTYHGLHYLHISQQPLKAIAQYVKRTIFQTIDRVLSTYTDRIICVCRSDYDKAIDVGVAHPDRTSIVYNGIEIDKFSRPSCTENERDQHRNSARQIFGIAPTEFVFGNVGRLHEQKGHKFLLRAFAKLNNCSRLAIVGDGELRNELVLLADELQISDRVLFLGACSNVYEFLSAIDVFVLPSLWEGQPIALVEALTVGKLCIASAVDGIPEIIEHGVNGYLVNPRGVKELTKIMNLAIEDSALLGKFSNRGISAIDPKFIAQNMATEMAHIYLCHAPTRSNSSTPRSR